MKMPALLWDPLPYGRVAARIAGGAVTVMFCVGLLLPKPWLSQTIAWLVMLPAGAWTFWLAGRSSLQGSGRNRYFWVTAIGLACYLAVLLLATVAAGFQGEDGLARHLWAAVLCIACVVVLAQAERNDRGLARFLGRWMGIAAAISALILIATALVNGIPGSGRLEGAPAFHWILNPNAIGGVYAMCFAVAAGHGLRRDISTVERAATVMVALLALAIVLLTQSRSAMLGCLAAIAVASFALPFRVSVAFWCLVAAAAALIAIGFPGWTRSLLIRGDGSRVAIWLHYLELCRERFWLGHGLDFDATYRIGCIDVRTPHIIVALARYHLELSPFPFFWLGRGLQSVPAFQFGCITIFTPHNILLAALLRGGALGLLSLAVALLGAMAATVVAARRGWWLPVIALASSLALSTVDHEMVPGLFGFYWYLFWLPLGLAAAAALTPPQITGAAGAAIVPGA